MANGEGHFRREQFGSDAPVLREDLGLRLDPLESFKRGSYRFTGEGVPAAEVRFVDRGRLEAGRSLETEALIGSILEMGRMVDKPAPSIKAVYACVKLLNKVMVLEGAGVRVGKEESGGSKAA